MNLDLGSSGDRFLDEHCHAGEILHDLHFDVASGLLRAPEHGRTSDDNGVRALLLGHVLDKLFQSLVDTRVLVRGNDKGEAFLLEDGLCTLDSGVDDGNDFET